MVSDFRRKQKRTLGNGPLLKLGAILIVPLLLVVIVADIKIFSKRRELARQVELLENKIQDIKSKNENLKQGIEKSDDNQYMEKVAREELDMQKPGEKVVSFVKEQGLEGQQDASGGGFWSTRFHWFLFGWQWIRNLF